MSKHLHAHVQIGYTHKDGGQVESLVSFNPLSPEDRTLLHQMLDEYLDYLTRRQTDLTTLGVKEAGPLNPGNQFKIWDTFDK